MPEEFLKPWQTDAVLYIEMRHSMTGAVPSEDDIIEYLNKKGYKLNSEHIEELKTSELFQASMDSRGIVINRKPNHSLNEVNSLTQRQMAAAASMTNLVDRRSDEKKLRDLGVSTEEWTNWLQNAQFAEYLRQRSEVMISNSTHEAHMGLMRGVRQGNTASIKLYYELTGRYNPNEENNVNIRLVIGRVLEAIQKHVHNPEVLNSLAVELSQIAIESGSPVAKSNAVPGLSTDSNSRRELM